MWKPNYSGGFKLELLDAGEAVIGSLTPGDSFMEEDPTQQSAAVQLPGDECIGCSVGEQWPGTLAVFLYWSQCRLRIQIWFWIVIVDMRRSLFNVYKPGLYTTQCLMAVCALYGRYIFCQLIKHWMSLLIMQQSFYILNEITDWELILVVHYILYDSRSDWSDKLQNGGQGTSSGPVLMWILCRYIIIIKWGNAAILFLFSTYISFGFIQHW